MSNPHPSNLMDLAEFRDRGYLQEVNRLFFHPLGLAMALVRDDDSGEITGVAGMIDAREDPEGFYFSDGVSEEKASFVHDELGRRIPHRKKRLGWVIQPARADEDRING